MSRQEFSLRTKEAAWARAAGVCECGCGVAFAADEPVEYDHRIPDALRKNNSLENCQVLRVPCHLAKTKVDVRQIAKAKRVAKKHTGTVTRKKRIVPGSKASLWKKPLHGPAVRRNHQERDQS